MGISYLPTIFDSDRARTDTRAFLMVASVAAWSTFFVGLLNFGNLLFQIDNSWSGLRSLNRLLVLFPNSLEWTWSTPFEAASTSLFDAVRSRLRSSDEECSVLSYVESPIPRPMNCLGTTGIFSFLSSTLLFSVSGLFSDFRSPIAAMSCICREL